MQFKPLIIILPAIFGIVGIGLLLGAYFTYQHTSGFIQRAQPGQGVVTDLVLSHSGSGSQRSSTYKPVVEFRTARGERIEFTGSVGTDPPTYRPGERVKVLYLPEDPYSAEIDAFWQQWFLVVLLTALGGIFATLGVVPILLVARADRRRAALRRDGRLIQARIQGVEPAGGIRDHGPRTYRIVSHWQDPVSGRLHVFRSENIGFDPTDYLDREQIGVRIDPRNPKRYYVDIGFLPELAD